MDNLVDVTDTAAQPAVVEPVAEPAVVEYSPSALAELAMKADLDSANSKLADAEAKLAAAEVELAEMPTAIEAAVKAWGEIHLPPSMMPVVTFQDTARAKLAHLIATIKELF